MKGTALLLILLAGFSTLLACKKKETNPDVPVIPEVEGNDLNITGNSWVRINETYFHDKEVKGIGSVNDNMILTFFDFIDQITYFLSGHLSGDTNLVKHSLNYFPNGIGLENVEVFDGRIFAQGFWDGIGLWEFKIDEIDDLPTNSWEPVSGAYSIQPTAFTTYASDKILGVATSPFVRSISGSVTFPDFDHSNNVKVNNLIEYNGDLICAGEFTSSNGTVLNNIAKWDGNEWKALGSGVNEEVRDLAVFDGKLVAAGKFTEASGNAECSYIAMWNGTEWESMESGLVGGSNGVHRLFVYNEQLFVGGDFAGTPTVNSTNIIKWQNGVWYGLPNTITEAIGEIGVYKGKLHVANRFYSMNGNFLMRLQ